MDEPRRVEAIEIFGADLLRLGSVMVQEEMNVEINLLGGLTLLVEGKPVRLETRKAEELIAYVACQPESAALERSHLAGTLRPDLPEARARKALSTDLWRIRRHLLDHPTVLLADHGSVGLLQANVDVRTFRALASPVADKAQNDLSAADLAAARQAVEVYRGEFLPECESDWCVILREGLRLLFGEMLGALVAGASRSDDWTSALHWAQRLLSLDPLLEHTHRTIVRCQFLLGNRGGAIKAYENCVRVLRKELGLDPTSETQAMFAALMATKGPSSAPPDLLAASPPRPQAEERKPWSVRDKLRLARTNISVASAWIDEVEQDLSAMPRL